MDFFDASSERARGVDGLYDTLLGAPFGMKDGAVPVLLAAALQHRADDVFLYQDWTFQPVVEEAHIERLLKAPSRFTVKRAAILGLRAEVYARLRARLGGRGDEGALLSRNASTLAVARPLIAFAVALPEYTRQTQTVSHRARAVSQALLQTTEPDRLIFEELPVALGLAPLSADAAPEAAQADRFVDLLRAAMTELSGAYEQLLDRIGELMSVAFSTSSHRVRLREDLRARSWRLMRQVIDPKLRAFLLQATAEDGEDGEWVEGLAMTLSAKPPATWTDHDVVVFESLVAERARWFSRLEKLHFEMTRADGASFEARRLTLTAPDGTEQHELFAVDAETRDLVADVLKAALTELSAKLDDRRAPKALLGALAMEVLAPEQQERTPVSLTKKRSKSA